MKKIYLTIVILSLIALIFSIIILIQKTTDNQAVDNFCSALNSQSQCETVQSSKYGKLFGIDNPWYGIAGFLVLGVLAGMNYFKDDRERRLWVIVGSIFSGLLAIWFLAIQAFVLGQYCVFCVIVDIVSIVLFILAIFLIIKKRKNY